jgi:hypothetical protein
MRIGIIAWGALIWDRRELPVACDGQQDGQVVAVKFSHISTLGNERDASPWSLTRPSR